jgi:CRISPR/Cas system-associated exonuclease Cas4 (RecB family)
MLTLAALRAKPHTSVSQVKTFIQCPRKYFIQYIKRAMPAFRPLALVFGTAWHETIAERLTRSRRDRQVPVDELRAHLRDGLIRGVDADGIPVLFEEEEQDIGAVIDVAMRMLDVFLARIPFPEAVHGVEVPFRLNLVHPVTGEIHPRPLVGAIDAIVEEHGKPAIWELKTGKKRWSIDQLDFDPQPTAYGMAARALGYNRAGLTLIVTTKGKKPDVQVEHLVRHRRDEPELVETAFAVARAVDAGGDYPNRGWQCRTCPYAGACGS